MEIVAGEASCYNLLAVISLRMEVHWKSRPITFQKSFLGLREEDEFTHKLYTTVQIILHAGAHRF